MDFSKTNLIISSSEPENLGRFYSLVMGLNLSEGLTKKHFIIKSKNFQNINFFKPSNQSLESRFSPPPMAICFESKGSQDPVKTLDNLIKGIISLGGKLIEGPIIETFGAEAWFADIEDNYFLVFVPLLQLDKK